MPTRKNPNDTLEAPQINTASLNAIKARLGDVNIDNAREEYEQDPITAKNEFSGVPDIKYQTPESTQIIDETPQYIPIETNTADTNTYGSNYYLIDSKSLPTKGKFYNGSKIWLRNLKPIEIKRLAYITEDTASDVINDIMKNVIKGTEWGKIKTADRLAIIFYVRMNTFPNPAYVINYSCNKTKKDESVCGAENKLSFTANDLDIKYISDEFDVSDLTIALPNGDKVSWRFPEIKDENDIVIATEEIKLAFQRSKDYDVSDVDPEMVAVSHLLVSVNGNILNPVEKYIYLTEMAGADGFVILYRDITTRYDVGLNPEVETVCKECGGRVSIPVMFSPEFFLPDYSVK